MKTVAKEDADAAVLVAFDVPFLWKIRVPVSLSLREVGQRQGARELDLIQTHAGPDGSHAR